MHLKTPTKRNNKTLTATPVHSKSSSRSFGCPTAMTARRKTPHAKRQPLAAARCTLPGPQNIKNANAMPMLHVRLATPPATHIVSKRTQLEEQRAATQFRDYTYQEAGASWNQHHVETLVTESAGCISNADNTRQQRREQRLQMPRNIHRNKDRTPAHINVNINAHETRKHTGVQDHRLVRHLAFYRVCSMLH